MAKRTRLTPQQIGDLASDLKAGVNRADIAKKYGISEATVYNWSIRLRKGLESRKYVAKANGANGHANPLEDVVITMVRRRLSDPTFATGLSHLLSASA